MPWTTGKIKAGLWVQAQVRVCDLNFVPIMVRQKGDPDSGAILLKIDREDGVCSVLTQVRDLDGNMGWIYGGGSDRISDADAETYIKRQSERDPDLWVIEIEDPQNRYVLDGKIVSY